MKNIVVDKDMGFKRIVDQVTAEGGTYASNGVRVGYWGGSDQTNKEGTTIGEYALINEYGAPGAGIPERPFMRRAFDNNEQKYRDAIARWHSVWLLGQITLNGILVRLGMMARNEIIKSIRTATAWAAANAPSVQRRKGSGKRDVNAPLRDTGAMMGRPWFEAKIRNVPTFTFKPGSEFAESTEEHWE